MTALQLLVYICAALLLQLAVGIGLSLRRRGQRAGEPSITAEADGGRTSSAAWQEWREFRVARREFEDAACTQCSFYLEPIDQQRLPAFQPGQYLTVSAPVAEGRTLVRCYSLSTAPDPLRYRITVKRVLAPSSTPGVPPGAVSTFFHDRVRVGDILRLRAPAGHFYLDAGVSTSGGRPSDPGAGHSAVPVVLIAGGIGITPMMSMLQWCLAEQPERRILLYYGVRNGREQAFKGQLEALARAHSRFKLAVVFSRPEAADRLGQDYQYAGHVDVALLRRTLPHGRHAFYVCGPETMMAQLLPALAEWGVSSLDLHAEAFGPPAARFSRSEGITAASTPVEAIEVQFRRSERTLTWDARDETLLNFAEHHGIVVESGCRSGSCGSCETRLISGTVRYVRSPDYDVSPGHCLLCLASPESAVMLDA